MSIIKGTFELISKNQLSIFIFHRVLEKPDPLFPSEIDAVRFDQILGWMKSWFNVLPLETAVEALKAGKLPNRSAAITFDDGYADNHDIAMPTLQQHGMTATFFIATGFLDGGRMWNDTIIESVRHCPHGELDLSPLKLDCHDISNHTKKSEAIAKIIGQIKYLTLAERLEITEQLAVIAKVTPPNNLMLTSEQVRKMRKAGMQIGAHTVSHPILARLDRKTAREEMANSKAALEALLNERVLTFAYPNGKPGADYLSEHADIAREIGFSLAVSTSPGVAKRTSDVFQLPRFTPWRQSRIGYAVQIGKNILSSEI